MLLIANTYTTHAAVAHCIGSEADEIQCDDMIMTVCESLISNDITVYVPLCHLVSSMASVKLSQFCRLGNCNYKGESFSHCLYLMQYSSFVYCAMIDQLLMN